MEYYLMLDHSNAELFLIPGTPASTKKSTPKAIPKKGKNDKGGSKKDKSVKGKKNNEKAKGKGAGCVQAMKIVVDNKVYKSRTRSGDKARGAEGEDMTSTSM
jgi:hypothetical protein